MHLHTMHTILLMMMMMMMMMIIIIIIIIKNNAVILYRKDKITSESLPRSNDEMSAWLCVSIISISMAFLEKTTLLEH